MNNMPMLKIFENTFHFLGGPISEVFLVTDIYTNVSQREKEKIKFQKKQRNL